MDERGDAAYLNPWILRDTEWYFLMTPSETFNISGNLIYELLERVDLGMLACGF